MMQRSNSQMGGQGQGMYMNMNGENYSGDNVQSQVTPKLFFTGTLQCDNSVQVMTCMVAFWTLLKKVAACPLFVYIHSPLD